MAKVDYSQLAQNVVKAVGGKENIVNVANCMTRLRFVLKDDTIPNKEEVSAIKGVKGVMNQGGQYQVIIGTEVSEVIKDVRNVAGISEDGVVNKDDYKVVKDTSLWNRFFKIISGCLMPMIGPMIAGGIIKALLVILTTAGVLSNTDGTYQLLYAAGDSILYFMPVIVGFTCGKVFDCNPYVTAVLGAAFLYPTLLEAVAAEGGITFLGIPVLSASYANTFLPIVLSSFVASKIEKLSKKIVPMILQIMIVPTIVLIIMVPLSWLVIGPVMNNLSSLLSSIVFTVFGAVPVLGGVLLGAFWQLVVLLGLHGAFIPILLNNLFTQGYDPVNAVLGLTVWALSGVALGYALRQKDPEKRSVGFSSMASALCGVTEPTIYSIALPNLKLFGCAMVGGGIAGGILAALGGKLYAWAGDGLFRIPAMINPAGLDISFYGFLITAVVAFAVSGILAFILSGEKKTEEDVLVEKKDEFTTEPLTIYAPVEGTVISREDIKDSTFAEGILGDGVGIEPEEGLVVAPFDGTISSLVDTKHAVGITSKDGMEVVVHVGVDTVKMKGEGFETCVKEGDVVKAGQDLIVFDQEKIKEAGYESTVVVLVINSTDYKEIKKSTGKCKSLDQIITVVK